MCLRCQTAIIVSYSCFLYSPDAIAKQTPTPTPSQENEIEREWKEKNLQILKNCGQSRFGMLVPTKAVVYHGRKSWLSIECLGYHVRREGSVKSRNGMVLCIRFGVEAGVRLHSFS